VRSYFTSATARAVNVESSVSDRDIFAAPKSKEFNATV
jgi:hypothetical protein